MAATNITFDDKILGQANALPENKKLTFTNANEIKNVVNNNATELTSTQANVATNTSSIATNVADIATNVADIATNTNNIAANTTNIATNVTNIGTNATNIATNTTDISTNTSAISTNTLEIAKNTTNIATNTTNIATNTSDINALDSRVTTNELNIADKAKIADVVLKADYSPSHSLLVQQSSTGSPSAVTVGNNTLIGRKNSGSSEIEDLNATEVKEILLLNNVDNTSDLNKPISTATQLALDLKATEADLTIAEGNISSNAANIATNTSGVSTNTSNISTNASNISTNASNIETNVIAISNRIEKNIATTYTTNALTTLTQAEYDLIDTPDATTIYFIV